MCEKSLEKKPSLTIIKYAKKIKNIKLPMQFKSEDKSIDV